MAVSVPVGDSLCLRIDASVDQADQKKKGRSKEHSTLDKETPDDGWIKENQMRLRFSITHNEKGKICLNLEQHK